MINTKNKVYLRSAQISLKYVQDIFFFLQHVSNSILSHVFFSSIASILYHKYQVLPHGTFSKCCHSWYTAANISNANGLLTDVSSRCLNHYRQICELWYCNSSWLTYSTQSSMTNIKEQSTEMPARLLWQRPALNNSHYLTDTFRSWHLSNQKRIPLTLPWPNKVNIN